MTDRKLFNIHHKDAPPDAIYIGRGSRWGNQWVIGPDGTRDEVCNRYDEAAELHYPMMKQAFAELHGKPLVCFCYPKRCHGETLIRLAARAHAELDSDPIVDF